MKKFSVFGWVQKKDLIYWIIILSTVFIMHVSTEYGNEEILSHWGFSGTIVSIILAVLAIIYSFSQSSATIVSTAKLIDSADTIQQVTTHLKETNINTLIDEFEKKIEIINKKIKISIDEKLDRLPMEMREMLSISKESQSSNLKLTKEQYYLFIESSSYLILSTFFALYACKINEINYFKPSSISNLVAAKMYANQNSSDLESKAVYQIASVLATLVPLNTITISAEGSGGLQFLDFSSEFIEAMELYLKENNEENDLYLQIETLIKT